MPALFDIIQQPDACQFTANLQNIVLKRKTSETKGVTMNVKLDDVFIYQGLKFVYDADGLITIYIKDIMRGLLQYSIPEKTDIYKLPTLVIGLVAENNEPVVIGFKVIAGGIELRRAPSTAEWLSHNFLTWQPQIITMPIWQPQWLSAVKFNLAPVAIRFQTRLYTAQGVECVQDVFTATKEGLVRLNVSFDQLWRTTCEAEAFQLTPIAYDVYGIGLMNVQDPDADVIKNMPFAQRFVIRPNNYRDKCFLFQNSLGGFDTVIASGLSSFLPDGESTTFINKGEEQELGESFMSVWQQNTGFIATQRIARQWHEFLNSSNRHIYNNGTWRRIVVEEYEIKNKEGDLNSYTFKYHLSQQDEGAYYDRGELPPAELPTKYFDNEQSN